MSALALPLAVLALFLVTAWGSGLLVYPAAAWAFRRWPRLARLAPVLAALPLVVGALVAVAGVFPGDPHLDQGLGCHCAHSMPGWLHLCPVHPGAAAGLVPMSLLAVALLLPGRARAWIARWREPRGLGATGPVVLDLPARTALVVGWLRPSVVVDRQLWEALGPEEQEAMLAHERAHLARRDPLVLWLLLALVSVGPRAPGHALVRAWLERAELCADAVAAAEVGPLVLAETLVHCARLGAPPASFTPAWTGGCLERRVDRLMGPNHEMSASSDVGALDLAALGLLAATALVALPWLHHQVEHVLNLSL